MYKNSRLLSLKALSGILAPALGGGRAVGTPITAGLEAHQSDWGLSLMHTYPWIREILKAVAAATGLTYFAIVF